MSQQYYHRCSSMVRAGAETPLSMKMEALMNSNKEMAEAIMAKKLGTNVEILSMNRFYSTDLMYQVLYRTPDSEKVQETTITELDLLEFKRS